MKLESGVLLFLFVVFCLPVGSFSQESKKPKVALVLSGGGAKGFAHIGALKIIEESGIPIDFIVGNSIGSIVGGLYAIGYSADEIEQFVRTTDWEKLLSDEIPRNAFSDDLKTKKQRYVLSIPIDERKRPVIPYSVIKGQNVLNFLCRLTANVPDSADFSTFPVPFVCVAADLTTGKEVIIQNGFLPTAIYSSMTIPGVFLPEEHNGYLMVDGGVANNFPVDVAKRLGADIIIGVDIRNDLHDKDDLRSMKQLVDQLINFYSVEKDSLIKAYCDILIRPDITGYSASSFSAKAVDTLIRRGKAAAETVRPALYKLMAEHDLVPREKSRELIHNDAWNITNIVIEGDYSMNESFIRSQIDLPVPGTCFYDEIKAAIDKLYGLGCFKKIYFKLEDTPEGKELHFILKEEAVMDLNVGMRINNRDAIALLFNYTQKDYKKSIGYLSVSVNISSNPGFDFKGEISRGNFPVLGLSLSGKSTRYSFYSGQEKVARSDLYYGAGKLYTYISYGRYSTLSLGYSGELFTGDIIVSSQLDSVTVDGNTFLSGLYTSLSFDNLDDYYFPKKGSEILMTGSLIEDEELDNINPVVLLKMRNYISVGENVTILCNIYGRTILTPAYPLIKANYIGGHDYELYFDNHLPFYGLQPLSFAERYTAVALSGLRVKAARNHYLSFAGNLLVQNADITDVDGFEYMWGLGFTYAIRSLIGPLELTTAYSPEYKKPVFSFNLGFWF